MSVQGRHKLPCIVLVLWCLNALLWPMESDNVFESEFWDGGLFTSFEHEVCRLGSTAESPPQENVRCLDSGPSFPSNEALRKMCLEHRLQAFLTLYLHVLRVPVIFQNVHCFSMRTDEHLLATKESAFAVLVGIFRTSDALCAIAWERCDENIGHLQDNEYYDEQSKVQQITRAIKTLRLHGFTLSTFLANYNGYALPLNFTETASIEEIVEQNRESITDALANDWPREQSETAVMQCFFPQLEELELLINRRADLDYKTVLFHFMSFFMVHQWWLNSIYSFKHVYEDIILPNSAIWDLQGVVEGWTPPRMLGGAEASCYNGVCEEEQVARCLPTRPSGTSRRPTLNGQRLACCKYRARGDEWKLYVFLMYSAGLSYDAMLPVFSSLPCHEGTSVQRLSAFIRDAKENGLWQKFLQNYASTQLDAAPEAVRDAIQGIFSRKLGENRKFKSVLDKHPELIAVHNAIARDIRIFQKNL